MTAVDVPVVLHDLSALPVADRTAAVARFLDEDRLRGFDLNTAPLWRITLFDLGKAGHRMVWTFSHAILDGSYTEVVREVFDAYAALGAGVAPRFAERPSYRDQIAWLQQDRSSRAEMAREFWRARLSGFVKPSTLDGVQGAAPSAGSLTGPETLRFRLSPSTSASLRGLCEVTRPPPVYVRPCRLGNGHQRILRRGRCRVRRGTGLPALFGSGRREDHRAADQHRSGSRACAGRSAPAGTAARPRSKGRPQSARSSTRPLVESAGVFRCPPRHQALRHHRRHRRGGRATRALKDLGAFTNLKIALHDRTDFALTLKAVARAGHYVQPLFRPKPFRRGLCESRGEPDEAAAPRDGRAPQGHAGGTATPAGPGRARARVVQPDLGSGAGAGERA